MAGADYRLCDVCRSKTFYDSNLNYEQGPEVKGSVRNAGSLMDNTSLDYLGDWVVICNRCTATHEIILRKKDAP